MRILNKHGLVVFFLIIATMAVFSPVSHGAASEILTGPYLQAVTTESIQILVETTSQDPVTVEYGETASYGEKARTQSTEPTTATPATYVHDVKLTGLQPNTRYHYRVVGSENADYTFTTGLNSGASFRFAFAADFRTGISVHDAISLRLKDAKPRFLLYGGDLCASDSYQAFKDEFFRPNELALISGTAFFNAPGNHEGWRQNTKAFTQAPESKSGTQDYYSFDYGDMHVLVLNNELPLWEESNQYKFAQQDLAGTTKTWKIVAAHRPAYCAGGHGEDPDMKTLTTKVFEPNKVNMVLGGHTHIYQHNLVNGIHHMVIGSAGAPLYEPVDAAYTIKSVKDYNFAVVDVTPGTVHMMVYNDKGTVLETIDLVKGVTPQAPTPKPAPAPAQAPTPTSVPATPAGGQTPSIPSVQVDLSAYYNQDGFSFDKNAGDGKYDNPPDLIFSCYSADLAKPDPVFEGVAYKYGPFADGAKNAVKCDGQTITLPQGQYASLRLLGSATQGNQTGTFAIKYADGTNTEVRLTQVDWCSSYTSDQKIVQAMDQRHRDGTDEYIKTYVFAYYLTPEAGKTVTGLILPKNVDLHVLAISLVPAGLQASKPQAPPSAAPTVLVARHSDWKYFDKGQDLGKTWREAGFDDSAWTTGKAPLGYGGKGETTAVGFGADAAHKYPTTYFRKTFTVSDPSVYREITLQIARDDGALAYLNGRLVAVTSMPPGTTGENVAYSTLAPDCGNDFSFKSFKIDPAWLVKGPNVLAVEVHQTSASSSDLFFDLELAEPGPALAAAPGPAPPAAAAPARDYTGALRFVVAADCQGTDDGYLKGTDDGTAGPRTEQLLKRIKELNPQPQFMLLAGDLIAGPNDAGRPITDVVPQYEAVRKHLTSVYPIEFFYPGIGNHQIKGKYEGEELFGKAFPEFKAEGFTEEYGRTVYYFDRGDTRIFMLNTNHPAEEHRIMDEQFTWLQKNIDPAKKHHIFVMHEPAFGTWHNCQVNPNQNGDTLDRYPKERDRFWNIVDKANGAMVFVGHEHIYSRRHIDGNFSANGYNFTQTVYQITTGGFGGGTNGGAQDTRQVDVLPMGVWHFTVVDIKGDSVRVRAIDINGKVIDEFEQVQPAPTAGNTTPAPKGIDTTTPGPTPGQTPALTQATGQSSPVRYVHLSWQHNDTAHTMTITWATTEKTDSLVRYGPTSIYGSERAGTTVYSAGLGLYLHTVELDGLTPNTAYHYSCGAPGGWSAGQTFVTAPPKGSASPVRIGVWADTQDDPGQNASFAETAGIVGKIAQMQPCFTINAGDMVVNGSYKNSWLNFLGATEPLNAGAPLMPAPGNHDNLGDQSLPPSYYDLLTLPGNEQWYSFDYGNIHLVSLHTGRPNDVPEDKLLFAPGTPQYEWLKNDLRQAGQDPAIKWKIVYMHYPPYAVGVSQSAAVLKHLAPLFDEFQVDLVITGHRHAYEAMKSIRGQAVVDNGPNFSGARGTVYAIVGPAGGNPAGGGSTAYTAHTEVGYAFGLVEIIGNKLTYMAYHDGGKIFDQWTITKA